MMSIADIDGAGARLMGYAKAIDAARAALVAIRDCDEADVVKYIRKVDSIACDAVTALDDAVENILAA